MNSPAPAIPLYRIARSFGRAAQHYDEHAALQREVADKLLHLAAVPTDAAILDLGCGTGYCSERLRLRHPQPSIVALDLALPMLHVAMRKTPGIDAVCANAEALPLYSAAFDLVVSNLTMQWCFRPAQLFAELFRVLRPGGQALLSTFGPATLREVNAAWACVDDHVHVNGFASLDILQEAAMQAGFACAFETELRQRGYSGLRAVAKELKGIGAHNLNEGRTSGLTSRHAFSLAEQAFDKQGAKGDIPVTWEIFYLQLRKPR